MEQICRIIADNDRIKFESPSLPAGLTLSEQIIEDKKYGTMKPANGKYFTYRAMNWKGKVISSKQIQKGVTYIWEELERKIPFEFRRAKDGEYADFKIYFRSTKDDPQLTSNTIMYHFYPINDIHSEFRGVCVVNTDFPFSIDGEPVDMHLIDREHYPKIGSGVFGATYDFDRVYRHEGPGHGMGLPHTEDILKVLSKNYSIIAKFYEDESPQETLPRLEAKYGKRTMLSHIALRWQLWKRHRFDNY